MYQRALALVAALLAAHCAWSAMSAEDISAPNVVLAKIAAIAPARLVGLRLALQRYAVETTARETPEHLIKSPRVESRRFRCLVGARRRTDRGRLLVSITQTIH